MSIKSQTPGIASDIPLNSKQKQPIYGSDEAEVKHKKIAKSEIDNISPYVKENMKMVVKPRGGEHR